MQNYHDKIPFIALKSVQNASKYTGHYPTIIFL